MQNHHATGMPPAASIRRSLVLGLTIVLLPTLLAAELATVTVGTVVDGPDVRLVDLRQAIEDEVAVLSEGEFDVRFPAELTLAADWTTGGVDRALDRLFAEPDVDVIIALGGISSTVVTLRPPPIKPVIAPVAIDPEVQGFPQVDGASGVHNLCYVAIPSPFERDLRMFHEIVAFRHLAVLAPRPILEALPELPTNGLQLIRDMGIDIELVPVDRDPAAAVDAIPAEVDAAYVAPLFQLDDRAFASLVEGLIERRIPSFSLDGHREVRAGILAGLRTETFQDRLARRTALNLQRILLGDNAGEIPVSFKDDTRLLINMATAKAVGSIPSWAVMGEAELIGEDELFAGGELTLEQALTKAATANLDLAAADFEIQRAEQAVPEARSNLLPRIDARMTGVQIDGDRAEASLGSQAERSASAALGLTQVLFAEPALANLAISRDGVAIAEAEREAARLDVVRDTVVAYLDVLRANNLERIRQDNLRLSRSNLDLARIRQRIGTSGLSEVLRWESRIAADRQAMVEAGQLGHVAEVALNRVLHNDLSERWRLEAVDFNDPVFLHSDPRFSMYVYNPISYMAFIDFMVAEGLARSPELAILDRAVASSRRAWQSARRTLFTPTVALSGDLTHRFAESGAGSDGAAAGGPLPTKDETDWSLALSLAMPLYTGGGNTALREQAFAELNRLRSERAAVAEALEVGIRSNMYLLGSSFSNIQLSRDAADAAGQSLELVTDAYASGAVSITELLDAQNAALAADLAAANAVYDYLIQLMEFERSVARFDFDRDDHDNDDLFNRLGTYFRENEVPTNTRGARP